MEATDGCEGNEEILCRGSDCNDLSFLFRMSNDVMVSVLSYLCTHCNYYLCNYQHMPH